MRGAVIDGVKPPPRGGQLLLHFLVHLANQFLRKITTRHARLVGDYDRGQAGGVYTANRFRRPRIEPKASDVIDVAHLVGPRAVAVGKHGPALVIVAHDGGTGTRRRSESAASTACQTSSTLTRVMQLWSMGQWRRKQ